MRHRKSILFVLFIAFTLSALGQQATQDYKILFEKAKFTMETKGDLKGAITLFGDLIKKYPKEREYAAKSQLYIGECYEKLGNAQARAAYELVVRDYADQTETVTLAKAKLTLGDNLSSRATPEAEQSFKQATDLFKLLKYEQAAAKYEKVIKLASKSRLAQEAQFWIGHCYFKEGKNELALKSFNTILKEFPGSNLAPVAELMVGQVQQTIAKEPQKRSVAVIDDNTILDNITGVKYTKISSWAGKNDIINPEISITDIFPNRKFLLSGNKVVSLDNFDSFTLFDTLSPIRSSRLSPDGTQVGFFSKNAISVIPISPVTGKPTGPARKLLNKQYKYGFDINWSLDGNNLIFSLNEEDKKISIWTLSIKDGSLKQITNPFEFAIDNMVYAKNGSNILYKQYNGVAGFLIKMKSIEGKSVRLLDSCAGGGKNFILSPDNSLILYNKKSGQKMLYRMTDKQQQELTTPEEVGDFVLWTENNDKVFFYRPSADKKYVMKVATIFGGSVFELGSQKAGINIGWSPNSKELLVIEGTKEGEKKLKMIGLNNQDSKNFDVIDNIGTYPSLSPDGSKMLIGLTNPSRRSNLSIVPVSLKDGKVTGKPILIYKAFVGFLWDCSWSPDGNKIALCDRGDVWICDAEGGTPLQLTKTPIIENFPLWSPDGKTISVYIRSTNQLRILNSLNGDVLKTFEKVEHFSWSPDGREITIAYMDGKLNSISLVSGKSRNIVNWKELSHCTDLIDLVWSPDGKWLAMNGYKEGPNYTTQMFLINPTDGKSTEVAINIEEDKEFIKWSPDSKWISYYSYDGTYKNRLESTLWEADLTDFMKKIKPGTEKGFTTDFDFKALALPAGGVPPDGTFTDSRDGHVYKYKKIGAQTWMTENLAYLPQVSPDSATSLVDKRFYVYGYKGYDVKEAKNTENYQKYGVLYNWPAAMNDAKGSNSVPSGMQGICPKGWHLPSDTEWMMLERTLGMSEAELAMETPPSFRLSGLVSKKLKSPLVVDDDDIFVGQSGFNALPGGLIYRGVGTALNSQAYFWTSTVFNDNKVGARCVSSRSGVYRWTVIGKENGNSIRCIKD